MIKSAWYGLGCWTLALALAVSIPRQGRSDEFLDRPATAGSILADWNAEPVAMPLHEVQALAVGSPVVTSLSPAAVRRAYGFDQVANQGQGQVIAIITAFDHPRIQADLKVFSKTFGLRACNATNGCLKKVYASGRQPPVDTGWALETALDVEWAHAIAPRARIMLVEAGSNRGSDMFAAMITAVKKGASVVSMSWGLTEFAFQVSLDRYFHWPRKNVSFLAAAGNQGGGSVLYPAASPHVLGIGGTSLRLDPGGGYVAETAWSFGSGGLSAFEAIPVQQANHPIPFNPMQRRGVPDVAYNADPYFGYAVYTSVSPYGAIWGQVGGTSAGAPQWAGLVAIANSMRLQTREKPFGELSHQTIQSAIYRSATEPAYAQNFHDIVEGSNGSCDTLCSAMMGYDYVTGLGSPVAAGLIAALQQ